MSSLAFLVSELQSLASETRRKHPEVREAAEKSLAILRSAPDQASTTLASDGPQSAELLRPVFMGCATKNAKIVAISLGSLQRLIGFKAVPQSAVPQVVATMNECASQGVDIQLRILQTILGLVTNFPSVHGDLLGDALLLCFRLQESRIAVVSSTAAATLRQLVMFVMDKVVMEDSQDTAAPELIPTTLPDGTTVDLQPSSRDAFSIFEDLCLLANAERPRFLKLEQLHKTFALELIESVLTNYHALFHKHAELLTLLPHHLCPLLLRCLSERPALFPLALRATRVVFLILKQFTDRLTAESEIFLMLLVKIVSGDAESGSSGEVRQPWMRVLAMEILRGLCADAELMRTLYALHDQQASSHIFSALLGALNRLTCEKPVLLGSSSQLQVGANIPASASGEGAYGTAVAGMVTATVSGVVGMLGGESGAGLSMDSAMKLQCIDQLDKAEAPPIPDTYIYLLALQSLTALSMGFSSSVLPLYTSILSSESTQGIPPAPPALNINSLPESTSPSGAGILRTTHAMLEAGWPALLAAHSFLIGTNLSTPLFQEVLGAFGALAQTCGVLGLATPRDAFLGSLAKLAIPSKVVSSVDAQGTDSVMTPRSGMFADISSTLAPAAGPPSLGDRNLACLKLLVSCTLYLAGSLGSSWYSVLEAMQNADYVLHSRMPRTATRKVTPTGGGVDQDASGAMHPEGDIDAVLAAIQRLFESSKNLEDEAFRDFVQALCKLSSEMVGMQAANSSLASSMIAEEGEEEHVPPFSPQSGLSPGAAHRRRVSGIHLSRTLRTGDFGIQKLALVSQLNIHRIIYRSPHIAWDPITSHLLATLLNSTAPPSIRIQAARTLDDILVVVPRNITSTGPELRSAVQQRVLDVLSKQVVYGSDSPFSNTTAIDIRKMGLESLHQILQTSGHTLVIGWEIIFEMLGSVCKAPTPLTPRSPISEASDDKSALSPPSIKTRPAPLSSLQERSNVVLVRIAFQSLTLVCDSLSLLSPDHLRLCIGTIAQFGRQTDTNIALTSAASLLWTVSDSIQAKRADPALEPQYSVLWMQLLTELLGLCTDSRREVRGGAIQTLFRTLQLYGGTLSNEIWHECIWKIVFPVLETITTAMRTAAASTGVETPLLDPTAAIDPWSDSKILALQAISGIMNDFLTSKIMQLDSFEQAWDVFITHLQDSFLLDERVVSTAAMRCLEKSLLSTTSADPETLRPQAHVVWTRTWSSLDVIGSSIVKKTGTSQPLSPATPTHRMSQIMTGGRTPFTQESLLALLAVLSATRSVSKKFENGVEWDLPALTRMMAILKAVITYPNSPDYRPDVDALSPVQDAVLQAIDSIDLNVSQAASVVLADLSEYATLPFLAAFDFEPPAMLAEPSASRPKKSKRVSYIAVSKKVMPWLVELYMQFKDSVQIYADGTLEAVLAAYSIPLKLKYDCPAPSKFGNDPPLWKTATTNFLQIVKTCSSRIKTLGEGISDEHVEGLWRQIIDVFRGGLLADTSFAESLPLEVQNAEENFDLALVATLEIDVVPHIADDRVPDYVITELAKMLQRASILHEGDEDSYTPPLSRPVVNGTKSSHSGAATSIPREVVGSTSPGKLLPRERFSYWCFDLLFLICSNVAKDDESTRRRLAALALPSLLRRCQHVLASYVADDALRGNTPFPRAREEEILYVLRKLLSLKLWPGTFWAAFSSQPSQHARSLPPIESFAEPSQLIADAVKRSSQAHLFHFYAVLGDIASVPRKPPAAWMVLDAATLPDSLLHDEQQRAQEVDARQLARAALKEIGKEIGVQI